MSINREILRSWKELQASLREQIREHRLDESSSQFWEIIDLWEMITNMIGGIQVMIAQEMEEAARD